MSFKSGASRAKICGGKQKSSRQILVRSQQSGASGKHAQGSRGFSWLLSALTITYLLHWAYLGAEKHGPSTIAYGQVFTGKNVIVLEDISGSMGAQEKSRLAALLNQLKAAGIKINATTETMGAGFWRAGEE